MQDKLLKLSKNSVIYFVGITASALISLLTFIVYTRLLTPFNYGEYYLVYSTALLFVYMIFGSFGFGLLRFWVS